MAHIPLSADLPGISGLLAQRPDTAEPLTVLADRLLRPGRGLSPYVRECIAAHVSRLNECTFCAKSHQSVAQAHERTDPAGALTSDAMRAVLDLAGAVQRGGRSVTPEHIDNARAAGLEDDDLHDVVLIAAAFCMYNRYVDGLGTFTPQEDGPYVAMGNHLAEHGYQRAPGV